MTCLVWAAVFAMFVVVLLGYFLGCLNGSVLVSHFIIRDDVRQHGSGNAGLTNFYRTYGAKYALGVILLDMGKTVAACLIGGVILNYLAGDWTFGVLLGGLGSELGHMFPVFFGFKGGKGILSGAVLVWLLNWRVALIAWGLFALLWLTDEVRLPGLHHRRRQHAGVHLVPLRPQWPVHIADRHHRRAGAVVPPREYPAPPAGPGAEVPLAHRPREITIFRRRKETDP